MSLILFTCASFLTDFYYFWHSCRSVSFRRISKLICVFEFMETVDIISLQQCFLVQIRKCVVYLNVWKTISPVSSPTLPFLSLSFCFPFVSHSPVTSQLPTHSWAVIKLHGLLFQEFLSNELKTRRIPVACFCPGLENTGGPYVSQVTILYLTHLMCCRQLAKELCG